MKRRLHASQAASAVRCAWQAWHVNAALVLAPTLTLRTNLSAAN